MENIKGKKQHCNTSSSDENLDKSIEYCINLGDVGHTMSESSSNEEKQISAKLPNRKKIKKNYETHDDDSDCQIVGYIPPTKNIIEKQEGSYMETLYPNQLQDKEALRIFDQSLNYDADEDDDQHNNSDNKHEYSAKININLKKGKNNISTGRFPVLDSFLYTDILCN